MVFQSANSFLNLSPSLEDVEREIELHREFIRALQGYRNSRLLTISRLPPDVLSAIFEILAADDPYEHSWLSAAHVCRGWRDIALHTPRMWSYISDGSRARFVELLLQRSGSAPLTLRSGSAYPIGDAFKLLPPHASRLREIAVRYTPSTKCLFPLEASHFHNLHTLKLHYHSSAEDLSPVDLLFALGKMEQLEILKLLGVLCGSTTVPDGITVVLSHLTTMHISTHRIETLAILGHFSCPIVRDVNVTCYSQVGSAALAPVASAFYGLIPTPSSTWKTTLSSSPSPHRCHVTMSIWPEDGSAPLNDSLFRISVRGHLDFQADLTLCSTLPIAGPSMLKLHHASDIDSSILQPLMRSLHCVQEAYLYHVQDILTILADTPATIQGCHQIPPFSLPSLKQIILYHPRKLGRQAVSKLGSMLAARQAIGAGIDTVTITNTDAKLSEADVAPLRPFVAELKLEG